MNQINPPMKIWLLSIVLLSGASDPARAQAPAGASGKSDKQEQTTQVLDPQTVKNEVQAAFNEWKEAYAEGNTEGFLHGFAQVADLVVRISGNEWIGFDTYRDALRQVDMPRTDFPFREVRIIPIDEFAAFVTYVRASAAKDENGKPLSYRGTLIYTKTYSGWKVLAWHSHALVEPPHQQPEFKQ